MKHFPEPRRASGFTLIELIVVMGLLALLFGMGVGLLSSLNPGRRAAVGLVQNVVRSARNNAIARAAPARVLIDPQAGTLTSAGMDVLGTWHFESLQLEGSSGIDGVAIGGHVVERGFLGNALSFSGEGAGAHAEIPVQQDPGFLLHEGFVIACALWVDGAGGRALDVGSVAGIDLKPDGSFRGWFKPESKSSTGLVTGGGIVAVDSPAGTWSRQRWMRVELAYDRRVLRLLVDGLEVVRAPAEAPVWSLQGPLMIGEARTPFPGAIDTLTVQGSVDNAVSKLPQDVRFAADVPRAIVFSADGALEREVHAGPLAIGLEYDDGAKARVVVHTYGTVE